MHPNCFSEKFFAAGLNLTEDARYIVSHPCQSLQSMTLSSYSLLLNWVKHQCPGSGKTCFNIICADFVGAFSNEFSQLVIGLNQTLLKETWSLKMPQMMLHKNGVLHKMYHLYAHYNDSVVCLHFNNFPVFYDGP